MPLQLGCQTYGWLSYAGSYGSTFGYRQVLAEVAKTGFRGVDMTGGFYVQMPDPETVARECEELGVRLVCFSHDVSDLPGAREKIAFLKTTGGSALMVGGGVVPEGKDAETVYLKLREDCARMAELSAELDFPVGFHNHLGTVTETPEQIERFLAETEIGWCPDLGHMASGGGDPLALLRKWGPRAVHCHLKDCVLSPEGKHVRFCELGRGNAGLDLAACLGLLVEQGFDGWATVEQDDTTLTPFTDQSHNCQYLASLGYRWAL